MSVTVLERDRPQETLVPVAPPPKQVHDVGRLPLHSGDRLARVEFERHYADYPDVMAELIEGVVYVSSPVRSTQHGKPHSQVMAWLGAYWAATPGVTVDDNTTLRIDRENELQPDACLWIEDSGRVWVDADDYLAGAPELVVEVAASSASYDLHDKLRIYRRNGVQEYLVLTTLEREMRWYNWQTGDDQLIVPDGDGVLRSQVFPGLWLNVQRFWQGDVAGVLAIAQQGLASDEHAAFVAQLTSAASN